MMIVLHKNFLSDMRVTGIFFNDFILIIEYFKKKDEKRNRLDYH